MPLSAPQNVAATAASCTSAAVSWSAPADVGAGVKVYRVFRNNKLLKEVSENTLSVTDSGLQSTFYSYFVEAVDANANTAASTQTLVYVPACVEAWPLVLALDSNVSITVVNIDGAGNIYVGGKAYGALFLVKFTAGASLTWVKFFYGSSTGQISDIAFDSGNNPYFVGTTSLVDFGDGPTPPPVPDFRGLGSHGFLVKLSSAGVFQWKVLVVGTGSLSLSYVEVDGSDNVAVAGYNSFNFYLILGSYTSGGSVRWLDQEIADRGEVIPAGLVLDASGNLVCCGSFRSGGDVNGCQLSLLPLELNTRDNFIVKVSKDDGACLASRVYGSYLADTTSTVVKSGSSFLITGAAGPEVNFGNGPVRNPRGGFFLGGFLAKYDLENNTLIWAHLFDEWQGIDAFVPQKICVLDNGDILHSIQLTLGAQIRFAGVNYIYSTGAPAGVARWSSNGEELSFRSLSVGAPVPTVARSGKIYLVNSSMITQEDQ